MATAVETPITAPPAIQIPGSQWRMALKPALPTKPTKPTHLQSERRTLPRSNTSRAGPRQVPHNNDPGSKPRSSDYPIKKSHLDGEKWENCIRMQFALKPGCRKLLRKVSYIGHWKSRWRKFEATRKGMGEGWRSVVNPNCAKLLAERVVGLKVSLRSQESTHSWQKRRGRGSGDSMLSSRGEGSHGSASRGHPPLLPPKPEGLRSWRGSGGVSRMDLDKLERQWWGDGFPVYMSEEDRRTLDEGRECWLDEVD